MVELTVADWPAAMAWYRDVLGLKVLLQVEADRFTLLEAGNCRIALKEGQPKFGTVLLAFQVDDLTAELDRLAARGAVLESPLKTSPEGYRRAMLRDLDGHRVCLFEWSGPENVGDPRSEDDPPVR